jgi:hypothetical protein
MFGHLLTMRVGVLRHVLSGPLQLRGSVSNKKRVTSLLEHLKNELKRAPTTPLPTKASDLSNPANSCYREH